jgi:hypothetical protein
VKKAKEVISGESPKIKSASNPKGSGRKPKDGVADSEAAAALGIERTAIRTAEQHVETATEFPFMQGS